MEDTIIDFQEARDFSAKMNATYGFVRQNFKGLVKSLTFFAGPPVLLAGVFLSEMFQRLLNSTRNRTVYNPFNMEEYFSSVDFFLKALAIFLFLLLGGVFIISTTYAYVLLYAEKKTTAIELKDVWKKTRELFWRNVSTLLLYYIGAILAAIVLLFPTGLLVYIFSIMGNAFGVLSIFLYYFAMIFLAIYFSMLFFIRCYEKIGFFSAIGRLFALTKNKLWSTFAIGGINVYLQYVFAILFLLPWYIYFMISSLHDVSTGAFTKPSFWSEALSTVLFMLYSLASLLLYALPLIALAFQYFSLVELREAPGLMKKLETLGQNHIQDEREDY